MSPTLMTLSSFFFVASISITITATAVGVSAHIRPRRHDTTLQSFKLFLYYFIAIMKSQYTVSSRFMCIFAPFKYKNNEKNEDKTKKRMSRMETSRVVVVRCV